MPGLVSPATNPGTKVFVTTLHSDPDRSGPSPLRSLAIGAGLIVAGTGGLILPVLPGWLLIIAGSIVVAGVVPPLKRAVSKVVVSPPLRRVIQGTASSRAGRRLIARAMRTREIRSGLTPSSRWSIMRMLLTRATGGHDERE